MAVNRNLYFKTKFVYLLSTTSTKFHQNSHSYFLEGTHGGIVFMCRELRVKQEILQNKPHVYMDQTFI
jgi:hypothetical protein